MQGLETYLDGRESISNVKNDSEEEKIVMEYDQDDGTYFRVDSTQEI